MSMGGKGAKLTPPGNYYTGFGEAQNNGGGYTFTSQTDPTDQQNIGLANDIYSTLMRDAQGGEARANQARDVYRQSMTPAFERQLALSNGDLRAGLGNQYFSTFGQLTANDKANQDAVARAGLEKDIYDAGTDYYNNLLNRVTTGGANVRTAQDIRFEPYKVMAQIMQPGLNAFGNYNQAQIQNQQLQRQQQASMGQALMSLAPLLMKATPQGAAIGAGLGLVRQGMAPMMGVAGGALGSVYNAT